MWYAGFADLILLIHAGFVCFVVLGGFLALKWPRAKWFHLPAAMWGALVEFTGWLCPLTPLEQWLREQAGEVGRQGDFIGYYLLPVLYPADLTRETQIVLGLLVVTINLSLYGWLWSRARRL